VEATGRDARGRTPLGIDLTREDTFDLGGMAKVALDGAECLLTGLSLTGLANGGHIVVALVDPDERPEVDPSGPNLDRNYHVIGERSTNTVGWSTAHDAVAYSLLEAVLDEDDESGGEFTNPTMVNPDLAGGVRRSYTVRTGDVTHELHLVAGVGSDQSWVSRTVAGAVCDAVGNLWTAQVLVLAERDVPAEAIW
jgi:hypothetical protein